MRSFLEVFYFQAKRLIKSVSTWIFLLLMIGSMWMVGTVVKESDTRTIGYVSNGSEATERIMSEVAKTSLMFDVKKYRSEEALLEDVTLGSVQCGFVFDKKFDEIIETLALRKSIEYVYSPYSLMGDVAKETVYSAVIKEAMPYFVVANEEEVFGRGDDEITEYIMKHFEGYFEGDEIFRINEVALERKPLAGGVRISPVHIVAMVYILAFGFVNNAGKRGRNERKATKTLSVSQKRLFNLTGVIATGIVFIGASEIAISCLGVNYTCLIEVILCLVLFLAMIVQKVFISFLISKS